MKCCACLFLLDAKRSNPVLQRRLGLRGRANVRRCAGDMVACNGQVALGLVDLDVALVAFQRLIDFAAPDKPHACA